MLKGDWHRQALSIDVGFGAILKRLRTASIRISPTQVQANDSVFMFDDDMDVDDFQACINVVDLTYCELEHSVIRKVPGEVHHSLLQ